jgi:aspartate-semialdehyde dehydrogenase
MAIDKPLRVGVVGATGVVGETFLNLLEEREFPFSELRLFASAASAGSTKTVRDRDWTLEVLRNGCFDGLDLVFFSSGDDISAEWAPQAVKSGAVAVDNSAAFRMSPDVHLVVPEINGDLLPKPGQAAIVANPNCSTIQLVLALNPIQKEFGLADVRVATYQSVSGAGRDGIEELLSQTRIALEGEQPPTSKVFAAPIVFDSIPQIGSFSKDPAFAGFTSEEIKIMRESRKILRQPKLKISSFTVRVPTLNGHAEAVWLTTERAVPSADVLAKCLASQDGIRVVSSDEGPGFPTQRMASGQDPTFVGRIHRDPEDPMTWLMWVVSDNLRKGAALNGIQIAEKIWG